MSTSVIAEYIRAHKAELAEDWERAVVAKHAVLREMERGILLDHLPEVLDGLASWVDGRSDVAERAFSALADGHALQRLGFGIELAVLNDEYARLRSVLLRALLAIPSSPDVRESLIVLNEGLDRAIGVSVRRYTEQRDYLRDRFVGILGHDLRAPLNAISMAANALMRVHGLPGSQRAPLLVIERASTRMGRMIADILDFARGHLGGGIPSSPRECDLGDVCRATVEEACQANPARAIRLELSGDLLGTFDPDRVHQVMANLIGNAIQHGTGDIVVRAVETQDRRAIVSTVASHGNPIPPEVAAQIFDPFFSAGDPKKGGMGLGLYIVAQVARSHGATCEVDSSDDGTVFRIRWPRTPRDETHARP